VDCASASGVKAAKNATLTIVAITLFIASSFLVLGGCCNEIAAISPRPFDPTSSSLSGVRGQHPAR